VNSARIDTQFDTAQVIETYLDAHPDIDGFYTLGTGPTGAPTARDVIAKLGRTGKIGLVGGDSTLDDLKAIQDGTQVAGVVQQQYLQGYFPPVIARLYFETGQAPLVVSTGPGAINKKNVADAIKLATWGLR
jgi:ABC-type sugar transport system substrate-binding protein